MYMGRNGECIWILVYGALLFYLAYRDFQYSLRRLKASISK